MANYIQGFVRQFLGHGQLLLLAVIFSSLLFFSYHKQLFADVNWLLYDFSESLRTSKIDDSVVLIEIDDLSIKELGRWPWPREKHAELIHKLDQAGADAIVFDVLFADLDEQNPTSDRALKQAIETSANVILPMHIERLGNYGQLIEVPPAEPFYLAAAGVGHVHIDQDASGITRGVFLREGLGTAFWPHLSLVATRFVSNDVLPYGNTNTNDDFIETSNNPLVISRDDQRYIPGNIEPFARFSFVKVLRDEIDFRFIKGKTVFIGATATGIGDTVVTPVGQVFGVEFNTWVHHAVKNKSSIQVLDFSNNIWILPCSFLALLLLGKLSPRWFLLSSLFLCLACVVGSIVALLFFRLWIPSANFIALLFLFYPYWSWLRLEKAVNFMRHELGRLQSEPLSYSHESGRSDLASALVFLQSVGCVNDWERRAPAAKDSSLATFDRQGKHYVFYGDEYRIVLSESFSAYLGKEQARRENTIKLMVDTFVSKPIASSTNEAELVTQLIAKISEYQAGYQRARKLHEQSLDKLQDAILIADTFGGLQYLNRAFDAVAGVKVKDKDKDKATLLSALYAFSMPDEDNWEAIVGRLYNGEVFQAGTSRSNDGKCEYLFQIRVARIFHDVADTIIVSFTDVSALRAAQREKEEALNFLSHDLRSPLVSVLSMLRSKRAAQAQDETLANIEILIDKNLKYADDYLHLSKAKSISRTSFSLVDMHGVFDQAYAQAIILAKQKNISIICERCDEDAWAEGDASLLERCYLNLISNAIKFSPPASTITLSIALSQSEVQLSVNDEGPGIADEDKANIFGRFKTRSSGANKPFSAGLGLYFVYTVAESHSGAVAVESRLGHGATFSISLPSALIE
jgi:CHASE2 domain-containing sensor protein/signal transduction histidine kinase